MSGHHKFSDLSAEIRKNPERAAHIDALKVEATPELWIAEVKTWANVLGYAKHYMVTIKRCYNAENVSSSSTDIVEQATTECLVGQGEHRATSHKNHPTVWMRTLQALRTGRTLAP